MYPEYDPYDRYRRYRYTPPHTPPKPTRRQTLDKAAAVHITEFRSGKISAETLAQRINRDASLYDAGRRSR
jgi:hypothetical protein